MTFPDQVTPDLTTAIQHLFKAMHRSGASQKTLELVHLRASQINGCAACVDAGVDTAKKAGETDERLHGLTVWRETPGFTDAERAALDLTEAATRLADSPDPVPDDVWNAAAARYAEPELAGIILMIATANFFNRINRSIKQPAGIRWS
jgi:AhpD family alkylhydroperoxidase